MKELYIVISRTGTALSTAIGLFSRKEYCHASLALDEDLDEMYSFGRRNPYNPFWGGYVREYRNAGTFGRFRNTKVQVWRVTVTDEQYELIVSRARGMYRHRNLYIYNYLGLFFAAAGIVWRARRGYYCSEFVLDMLRRSGVYEGEFGIIHPTDLPGLTCAVPIYEGLLRDYAAAV